MCAQKKSKSELKKASSIEAFVGLPNKITALLATESDRAVILIMAAYLEELLGLIITTASVSEELAKTLLVHGGPCGDFESKILLARAFGLIHEEDAKPLRFIQQIRNKAAHFDRLQGRGFDVLFDSPSTADKVEALGQLFDIEKIERQPEAVKSSFTRCARMVASRLCMRLVAARPATACVSHLEFIAESVKKIGEEEFVNVMSQLLEEGEDGSIDMAGQLQKLAESADADKDPLDAEQQRKAVMLEEMLAMMRLTPIKL